jgi:hypothetical protein
MPESIVVIRLSRNLRYKLTYVKIFETFLESERQAVVVELLRSLLQAYQTAIGPLASYLRRMEVAAQELELDEKLLDHASSRGDTESQLRFIHDGLSRAALWYKTQLADRQMAADPELRQLLVELGEIDAAKLWRTEAVMASLKIPLTLKEPEYSEPTVPEPQKTAEWRPRLVDDVRRPNWSGRQAARDTQHGGQAAQGERGSSRATPETQSYPRPGRGPRRSEPRFSRQPPERSGMGEDKSPHKGGKPGDLE